MTQNRPYRPHTWLAGAALCATLMAGAAYAAQPAPAAGAKPAAATSGAKPAAAAAAPAEEPSTLILSDTLKYDDMKKISTFTGNVVMTRGLMKLTSDTLEMRELPDGNQQGTATANKGKLVEIRQERPETFETVVGTGLRAEYDDKKKQFDLIGQAIVTRYACGKPFDSIRGERVRYIESTGTYEAMGGPDSSAAGGRVRSVAEPRAKSDAAIAACRQSKAPAPKAP